MLLVFLVLYPGPAVSFSGFGWWLVGWVFFVAWVGSVEKYI